MSREQGSTCVGMSRKSVWYKVWVSGDELISSKKDVQIRRRELMEYVSKDLLDIIVNYADELMRDPVMVQVVQETILNAQGKNRN